MDRQTQCEVRFSVVVYFFLVLYITLYSFILLVPFSYFVCIGMGSFQLFVACRECVNKSRFQKLIFFSVHYTKIGCLCHYKRTLNGYFSFQFYLRHLTAMKCDQYLSIRLQFRGPIVVRTPGIRLTFFLFSC